MTAARTRPPERLLGALATVAVGPDARTATVAGTELAGDGPAELTARLATELYRVLHAGAPAADRDAPRARSLRDPAFESALATRVGHPTAVRSGRVLDGPFEDGALVVRFPEAAVRVPARYVPRHAPVGEIVRFALPPARPALSPGFFLVDGPSGHPFDGPVRRIYLHVQNPDAAPEVFGRALAALTDAPGFRAKVLSERASYPRRDAVVVYLPVVDGADAAAAAVAVAVAGLPGVGATTSAFAEELAPGVAVADEPADDRPGMAGMSFGQHRARAAAAALVGTVTTGEPLADLLAEHLLAANVRPDRPARNLGPSGPDPEEEP